MQIFIIYFGLASVGIKLGAFTAAIAALVINVGAYTAEIVRAGIEAVPRSQLEAAQCLALGRWQVLRHVVLPPAIERVWPALTSQYVLLMLASSITSQISTDKLATEGAKGAQIVRFDDDATLITAIASGQVAIAATAPALVKTIRDSAPQRDIEVKFVMKSFPLGIGMRKCEAKLQGWINGWIQTNTSNSQFAAIHKKFHG